MKNPLFSFANCLRHAFMTGAGYGDLERISDEDQRRWCMYDPPQVGSFATMASILAGTPTVVDVEPEKGATMPLALFLGKDLEYMRKNISSVISSGSIWRHAGNGAYYRVERLVLNTITDEWDVEYEALYPCGIEFFTRQAVNHEKAFYERFTFVAQPNQYNPASYPDYFREPPKEQE